MSNPPAERPLMIFDGDCNFCRRWVARWKAATGGRVDYAEFQAVGHRFPEIAQSTFEEAVQLVEPDGRVFSGADAVFRVFDFAEQKRGFLRGLGPMPGFMPVARFAYGFIARHRSFFSFLTRLIWGK